MNEEYILLKKENKYSIIIIKSGLFYNVYGRDAIIISNITNYKLFFYNDKLCISFPKESLNLLLSRLRTRNIGYIVLNKNSKEIYLGKDVSYIKEYNESSKVRERELILEEILIKIKKLDYDKIKEINNSIERK